MRSASDLVLYVVIVDWYLKVDHPLCLWHKYSLNFPGLDQLDQ